MKNHNSIQLFTLVIMSFLAIVFLMFTGNEVQIIPQEFMYITDSVVGLGIFRAYDMDSLELFYEDTVCRYMMGDTITISMSQIKN